MAYCPIQMDGSDIDRWFDTIMQFFEKQMNVQNVSKPLGP